ncbi:MAG: type I-B CRISPR-associated protein Cas7/Cst2/DevR [Dehalococcoidales bacterium]|nr:type I-B CRISPR-associated protein Cas7/Cst2/DevR [Dehalococcoidales bacterium]
MAFVTGLLLIDAPASALNNAGGVQGDVTENEVEVKAIRTREGIYPYVSAQAFRYWLRNTLTQPGSVWKASPMYRELKIAYTAADPVDYWDDDLFGYVRAPGGGDSATRRRSDPKYEKLTPLEVNSKGEELAVTRLSPFRVSTFVSLAPATVVRHFESMSRHDGDPIPYIGQFYRATLKGLFSLDVHACGTFSYRNKTGFRNLDSVRIEKAKKLANHIEDENVYRLPLEDRIRRITTLFEGLAALDGGAKQALHYTDVAPALVVMAVTKGGNHIFGHVVGANSHGLPKLKIEALKQSLAVFKNEILSDVYIGWVRGYLDDERAKLDAAGEQEAAKGNDRLFHLHPISDADDQHVEQNSPTEQQQSVEPATGIRVRIGHPRRVYQALIEDLKKPENASWLE